MINRERGSIEAEEGRRSFIPSGEQRPRDLRAPSGGPRSARVSRKEHTRWLSSSYHGRPKKGSCRTDLYTAMAVGGWEDQDCQAMVIALIPAPQKKLRTVMNTMVVPRLTVLNDSILGSTLSIFVLESKMIGIWRKLVF